MTAVCLVHELPPSSPPPLIASLYFVLLHLFITISYGLMTVYFRIHFLRLEETLVALIDSKPMRIT